MQEYPNVYQSLPPLQCRDLHTVQVIGQDVKGQSSDRRPKGDESASPLPKLYATRLRSLRFKCQI